MKTKMGYIGLTIAMLALAVGCNNSEKAAPSPSEADKPVKAEPAPPKPAPEGQAQAVTNVGVRADQAAPAAPTPVKSPEVVSAPATSAVPQQAQAVVTPPPSNAPPPLAPAGASLASLSQDQLVSGMREALGKGLQQAVAGLGRDGGFLTNVAVKIPLPEKLQKAEGVLRAMRQDKVVDDFVATMNHAAEQAVPEAGVVFADALKQMSIEDARSILAGPNDAATQYFQRTTQTNLYGKFYPMVQKATLKTGVTAAYKNLMDKANLGKVSEKLGGLSSLIGGSVLDKDSLDIDAYVTNKALDGLFKMVADEEKRIRQNPIARTTDLLQKVFGGLKK